MTIEQFDRVRLLIDRPDLGLRRGMTGVAVDVYEKPCRGYEVEFMDAEGRTIAVTGFGEGEVQLDPWTREEALDWIGRIDAQVAKDRVRFPTDYALDAMERAMRRIRAPEGSHSMCPPVRERMTTKASVPVTPEAPRDESLCHAPPAPAAGRIRAREDT